MPEPDRNAEERGIAVANIVLYQFPPILGLPSLSPFCVKVRMALNMARIEHRVHSTFVAKRHNPRGKLPYLTWDDESFEDSTAILHILMERVPELLQLLPEDPLLAADVHLLEDWADESLYWFGVYARFYDGANWRRFQPHLGEVMPRGLATVGSGMARRGILRKLRSHGLSARSPRLVRGEFGRHMDALDAKLDGNRYLIGDRISLADLAVVSMLLPMCSDILPNYRDLIRARAHLSDYVDRVAEETDVAPGIAERQTR